MSKKDIYEDREREESDSSNDLTPVLAGICLNLFEQHFPRPSRVASAILGEFLQAYRLYFAINLARVQVSLLNGQDIFLHRYSEQPLVFFQKRQN